MALSVGQMLLGRFRVEATRVAAGALERADAVAIDDATRARILALPIPRLPSPVDLGDPLSQEQRFCIGATAVARPVAAGLDLAPDGSGAQLVVAYDSSGPTLDDLLGGGPLPLERVASIVGEVAAALAPLHDQGIAHGHLRLELIAVGDRGVVVEGFGLESLARRVRAASAATPYGDVHALGIMVTELLSGRRVADGVERPTPRAQGVAVSDALESLVARAVAPSLVERPELAVFARELAAAAAAPIAPPPRSEAEPVPPTAPVPAEHSFPPIAAPLPPPAPPAPPLMVQGPPPSIRPRSSAMPLLAVLAGVVLMLMGVAGLFVYWMARPAVPATAPPATATAPPVVPPMPHVGPVPVPLDAGAAPPPSAEDGDGGVDDDGGLPFFAPGDGGSRPGPMARSLEALYQPMPLDREVPLLGKLGAPVTVVVFGDLECPFTRQSYRVLEALRRALGDEVAVAWRHRPLPKHSHAAEAARAAIGLHAALGNEAFWRLVAEAARESGPADPAAIRRWVSAAGGDASQVGTWIAAGSSQKRLEQDLVLAGLFDVRATPTFFVNGIRVEGFLELDPLRAVVDKELRAAKALAGLGTPLADIYAARVRKNMVGLGTDVPDRACPEIAGAPARGAADALVTIVEFSDFECRYCKSVQPTLQTLLARHGGELRLVWKNHPLDIHPRARPAAALAFEALAQGGPTKFWKVHDLIFLSQNELGEARLGELAGQAGLDVEAAKNALRARTHDAKIDADIRAGKKLGVTGTPTFFVNGRLLQGAQPLERFQALVQEELDAARRLVATGTPRSRVYETVCRAR